MTKRAETLIFYISITVLLLIIAGYAYVLADLFSHPGNSCMSPALDKLALGILFTGPAISFFTSYIITAKQERNFKLSSLRSAKFFLTYLDIGIIGYFLGGIIGSVISLQSISIPALLALGLAITLPIVTERVISRALKKETASAADDASPSNIE